MDTFDGGSYILGVATPILLWVFWAKVLPFLKKEGK